VGVIAVPSLHSLLPSCHDDCSPEQLSCAPPWRVPLRPPHHRPEPSIKFVVITSRSQAKSLEKSRPRTTDSVNYGDSAASLVVGCTAPPPAPHPQPSAAVALGSNGPDSVQLGSTESKPVSLGAFAKEALQFLKIKPQSTLVQKYLQNGPFFSI
jgi:hypothetical protein